MTASVSPRLVLVTLIPAVFGLACGDRTYKIDAEQVNLTLDRVDQSVPLCAAIPAGAPSSARVAATTVTELHRALTELPRGLPRYARSASGSCGGTLDVFYEHEHGVTDYDLNFAAYCLQSDDGPVVLDGRVLAREEGNPTNNGPKIKAFEAKSDGELVITQDEKRLVVELGRIRTEYGNPNTWAPDAPDERHPDKTEIDYASVHYPNDDGRTDYLRNVRTERTSGWPATVHITGGEAGTRGEGVVDLSTPKDEPLIVQVGVPLFQGGAVILSGRGGTEAIVRPNGSQEGVFDVEVNGVPFDRGVDCGPARGVIVEAALALFIELPLH